MWEERFNTEDYVFGRAPAAFLLAHAEWLTPGASALSVADGEGRNSVFLAQKGLHSELELLFSAPFMTLTLKEVDTTWLLHCWTCRQMRFQTMTDSLWSNIFG